MSYDNTENNERLIKQMAFAMEADKCKNIGRQTYISSGDRKENDAEHAFSLALMVSLLAEHANEKIDKLKAMEMVLIHDLVEIDAGDTYAYDAAANESKREREEKAADRIFAMLPDDQAKYYRELWEDFEAYASPEARFAHTLDNLQPLTLNDKTDGKAWREHEVRKSQVMKRNERTKDGSEVIWNYLEAMINKNVEKGNIKDE